ncbi:MAG: hypothetical protein JWP22_3069 [Ramlibacter sp.]|nr:hypothetical protein [Ramlibacter sp.]MDB5914394.1 hypothetical protein [Ramlibacter sp.]
MRTTRTAVLVIAILLVAGFAALNWGEIVRNAPLSFGLFVMDAPLGAILLGLLAVTLVLFLASTAAMRTQSLMDYRAHQKNLDAQRELADKAEASRFVDLRQHLDTHLRAMGERDTFAAAEFDKALQANQRELRTQMEQINRTISARLNELEHRLETRFERMGVGGGATVRHEPVTPVVTPAAVVRDPVQAAEQAREDERQQRERAEAASRDEKVVAADKPAENGWRRWF